MSSQVVHGVSDKSHVLCVICLPIPDKNCKVFSTK